MCLAIPGEIISIIHEGDPREDHLGRTGRVSFGGVIKEVNLSYVPDAEIGEFVIVHVGFALHTIDKEEAGKVFEYLEQMNELAELESEP